jgi:hypothetical protein
METLTLQDNPVILIGIAALVLFFMLIFGILAAMNYAEKHRAEYQHIRSLLYYTLDSITKEYGNDEVLPKHDVVRIMTCLYNGHDLDIAEIRQQARRRAFLREQK